MTPLGHLIARRIARTGPMTVADYMADCLTHPEHGYYTTRDPLGVAGDFTTAPEISQMFGELLGLCLAQAWRDQGAPSPVVLAELGPGRGSLMADALRATAGVPGFHAALTVHLVELSPRLRAAQAERLAAHDPVWHDSVAELPAGPLFLVANEFLDALPIRQFVRRPGGWAERMVAHVDGRLTFALAPAAPIALLDDRTDGTEAGALVETCAPAAAVVGEVARRIARDGGAALIVDYGGWGGRGDTFQAVAGHAPVGPLAAPGRADLTAHVDFAAVAAAARRAGAVASGMTPQGVLLERLGITERARRLAAALDGPALDLHVAAHRRLTHPDAMGHLFKAMSIHPRHTPTPPGFDP